MPFLTPLQENYLKIIFRKNINFVADVKFKVFTSASNH